MIEDIEKEIINIKKEQEELEIKLNKKIKELQEICLHREIYAFTWTDFRDECPYTVKLCLRCNKEIGGN